MKVIELFEGPAYERDLDETKPIIVQGVKGMKSTPFRKRFKNFAAYQKWIESEEAGNYEVSHVVNEGWKGMLGAGAIALGAVAGVALSPKVTINGVTYDKAISAPPADAKTVKVGGKKYKLWYKKNAGRQNRTDYLYKEIKEDELKEFATGGDFKPPKPPKNKGDDPWGNDDHSKIIVAVGKLINAGNRVDWKVPGQMGHVEEVNDNVVFMKRWNSTGKKGGISLTFNDDQDSEYQIVMKAPKHYEVISA